ncbi:hypothetical protein GOODEAATRI_026463 [Goodea atripinnis]|uniref:Uncharacterized protein n=1 Tax=Goodea atripinnis TaxID=208336 RepID=A0ABV0Q178_9TELE
MQMRCMSGASLKAKKEEGNQAFKNCNYEAAYLLYTEALAIDPNNIKTNAKLYCNRATAGAKVAALNDLLVYTLSCCTFRSQTSAEDGTDGAEEEQKERLLQGAGSRQERHRGRDKKGVPQAGPHAPPGYLSGSCCTPITSL